MTRVRDNGPVKVFEDGLPDPTGSLASEIPSSTIVQANQEVQQLREAGKGKRGPYKKYGNIVLLTTSILNITL